MVCAKAKGIQIDHDRSISPSASSPARPCVRLRRSGRCGARPPAAEVLPTTAGGADRARGPKQQSRRSMMNAPPSTACRPIAGRSTRTAAQGRQVLHAGCRQQGRSAKRTKRAAAITTATSRWGSRQRTWSPTSSVRHTALPPKKSNHHQPRGFRRETPAAGNTDTYHHQNIGAANTTIEGLRSPSPLNGVAQARRRKAGSPS